MTWAKKTCTYLNISLFLLLCFFSCFGTCSLFSVRGNYFSFSFYISLLALPLFYLTYLIFKRHDVDFIIKLVATAMFLLIVSSLGMALIITPRTTSFTVLPTSNVIKNAIKYLYDLALIPYFCFMVSFVRKKWAVRLIDVFFVIWILFGIFQILAFEINNPVLWRIYDAVDVLKIIGGNSTMLGKIRKNYASFRFYGFASEPANNCLTMCFQFVYLYWRLFKCQLTRKEKIEYGIFAFFLTLFAILTKSASVYTGVVVLLLFWFAQLLKTNKIGLKATIITLCCLLSVAIACAFIPQTRTLLYDDFILKLFNHSNQSTQYRYSTIWNDALVFIRIPIVGIGDGNQGYFYASNVSGTWMSANGEAQRAIQGKLGLLDGGAAIPSLISGFGIYGVVVIALSVRSYLLYAKKTNSIYNAVRPYAMALAVAFAVMALATVGIHRNYPLFLMIVIPLIGRRAKGDTPLYVLMTKPSKDYWEPETTVINI